MCNKKNNKGFALITALLIVALATIVSVNIASHLQLDIRRTSNMLANEQAMLYALEAENLLRWGLYEDIQDNNFDYYRDPESLDASEKWSDFYEFPFDNALIRSQAVDIQACINLNSLVINGTNVDVFVQDRLRRLFSSFSSNANTNSQGDLTQAIIDWIDVDSTDLLPDGAEDTYYLNLETPYYTANTPLSSVSELRLIKGFEDSDFYDAIEPFVCAFGAPGPIRINVNTAPEEVLNSLANGVNGSDIIACREDSPFENLADFTNCINSQSNTNTQPVVVDTQGLSPDTNYFLLKTEIKLGNSRSLMYSIIYRDNNGATRVLARSQGAY